MNENLNRKLLQLQQSVKALAKDADGYGYQYVSGSKLLYFIRPKMDELKLRLVPNTISVEQQIVVTAPETMQKDGSIKPAKQEVLVLLHKSFTWIDVESGESETTDFYAQGCNGWDKAIGSAETYAERYFILKYFHIATDEDDVDALKPEQASVPEDKPKKKATKSAPKEEPAQAEPASGPKESDDSKGSLAPADTVLKAVKAAQDAKTAEELVSVWNANRRYYGNDPQFIMAISTNPHNPKKR